MAIDRTDNDRDDNRRIEKQQDEVRRDNKSRKTSQAFQAQYQSVAQNRRKDTDPKKDQDSKGREGESAGQKNESLLFKIVQSVKSHQDKSNEDKSSDSKSAQDQSEIIKKDEDRRDESIDDRSHGTKSTQDGSKSDEVQHRRIDGFEQQGRDSNDSGGQSGGGGSSGGGQGFQSGSRGFSQDHGGSGHSGGHPSFAEAGRIAGLQASDGDSGESQSQSSWKQSLNQLVEAIFVGVNREGEESVLLKLNDPQLAGIQLSIVKKPQGLHIRLVCENKSTRNKLVLERLNIFERLKKKHLTILRIDIE